MAQDARQTEYSEQNILNNSYDKVYKLLLFAMMGFDGSGMRVQEANDVQTKIVDSGGYTYICKAPVGTAEATAGWKIYRIDTNGSKVYADGDSNFDNVATDPTSLTYSYT